eukprot:scaffold202958_cov33-Tisochrysis_lutea.AAC.1
MKATIQLREPKKETRQRVSRLRRQSGKRAELPRGLAEGNASKISTNEQSTARQGKLECQGRRSKPPACLCSQECPMQSDSACEVVVRLSRAGHKHPRHLVGRMQLRHEPRGAVVACDEEALRKADNERQEHRHEVITTLSMEPRQLEGA